MSLFAEFEARGDARRERAEIRVREAVAQDIARLAELNTARQGGELEDARRSMRALLASEHVLVAEHEGEVVGYGKCAPLERPAGAPCHAIPTGWYLTGVVVDEALRRRGIGAGLTRARLAWLFERTDEAYYFANSKNRVSIALHAALGFEEVERDVWAPGCSFSGGGVGVLFRLARGEFAVDEADRLGAR